MLNPVPLHILVALAERDSHGYGLMQAIREASGGRVPVHTASFYRHLGRLLDDGLVAEAPTRPGNDDPRRGVYYRLTPRGRQALADERRRLRELLTRMNRLMPTARKAHV